MGKRPFIIVAAVMQLQSSQHFPLFAFSFLQAKRQRHQYQLYLRRNPKCTLTPDRIQALGKIGFCFDHQQIKWLQRFEELKAYAKEHGHCRVPVSGKEKKLGAWVKHQKAQRRLYDDGQPSFITENRISMLDSVGMVWRMR